MLLNFRVANHRSLRDEQELDLRPVYDQDKSASSVAAVFGANASGKSSVLDALRFMHDAVLDQNNHWQRGEGIPRKPFALDDESPGAPSSFAVELLLDGVRHVYGFTVDDRQVLKEWCYSYPTSKRRTLFRREGQEFTFGTTVSRGRSKLLAEITPPNVLFMTTVRRTGQEPYRVVADWFRRSLWFQAPDEEYGYSFTRALIGAGYHRDALLQLLRAADLGIMGVEVKRRTLNPGEAGEASVDHVTLPLGGDRQIDIPVSRRDLGDFNDRLTSESVRFTHGGRVAGEFSISEESHGTKVWFNLLGLAVEALVSGWTLVIDEIGSSLHPLLLAEFVRLFQAVDSDAQLICTTHDATLLGRRHGEEILKRDQVWFTEKDPETGASTLYALAEFSPKLGLNWERKYLGGAVGGVPFIDDQAFLGAVRAGELPSDG